MRWLSDIVNEMPLILRARANFSGAIYAGAYEVAVPGLCPVPRLAERKDELPRGLTTFCKACGEARFALTAWLRVRRRRGVDSAGVGAKLCHRWESAGGVGLCAARSCGRNRRNVTDEPVERVSAEEVRTNPHVVVDRPLEAGAIARVKPRRHG